MKNLSHNSFIFTLKELYLKIIRMEELVWISSIGWIFWSIFQIFSGYKETIIIFIFLIGLYFIYTLLNIPKMKPDNSKKWRKSFMRLFNIPGSILFLFLFCNSFLKISEPINQKFATQIKSLEETYSTTLFGVFILSVFFFGVFRFFIVFKRFLINKMERKKDFLKELILIIFIIAILLPFVLKKTNIPFYATFFAFISKWFFWSFIAFPSL